MAKRDSTTETSPLEETPLEHPTISKTCKKAEKSINKLKALAYAVVKGEVPEGRVTRAWAIKFARQVRHQADDFDHYLRIIRKQWKREISIDNDQIREVLQKDEYQGKTLCDLLYIYANPDYLCPAYSTFDLMCIIRQLASDGRQRQQLKSCWKAETCVATERVGCKFAKKPKAQILALSKLHLVKANHAGQPQPAPEGGE